MGQTALLDAFAQSDLDMKGFKILNCPSFGVGPQDLGAVPHEFVNAYSAATGVFGVAQPQTADLSDWPNPSGHAGQALVPLAGGGYQWVAFPNTGGPGGTGGFINVKNTGLPSGNAVGDGVHNDGPAIQGAINAAAAGPIPGLTVYFPAGTYLLNGPLNGQAGVSLLGDNPWQCVLKLAAGVNGGILLLGAAASVTRLGFDGNKRSFVQGNPTTVIGVGFNGGNAISMFQCVVIDCLSHGIAADNCFGAIIRDCYVIGCGGYGIECLGSPQSLVVGNTVQNCSLSGIWMVNSPQCVVDQNQVYSCGPYGWGIGLFDSDNTGVRGNKVQQCAMGIVASITTTRAITLSTNVSYGYVLNGNNVLRNYYNGILLSTCHGFNVTGNVVTDCGQGGTDNATNTVEPGIVIDSSSPGTGYAVGDVLTVVGGVGTAAKVVVTRIGTGGAITNDGLAIISTGSYTTLPTTNPLTTTCGRSGPSGARVIMTATLIGNGGSGYVVGQVLRATNGTFYNPVRVMVTSVGAGGVVTGYRILDGGGYTGGVPSPITFSTDVFAPEYILTGASSGVVQPPSLAPDVPETSGGFTLVPLWGMRYSQNGKFGGLNSSGIRTYGAGYWGIMSANQIDWIRTGTGILISDGAVGSPYHGRSNYLNVTGNILVDNLNNYMGATDGSGLDTNYLFNSQFANNLTYP